MAASKRLAQTAAHLQMADPSLTTATIQHESLGATLTGVRSTVRGVEIAQFRGLKYGVVPGWFEVVTLFEGVKGKWGL
jgi:hypothetical protein